MELKRKHLLVLLLLAEGWSDSVDRAFEEEAQQLCGHGYIESNGDLTEKGEKAIAYAVKKAGEV